MIVYCLTSRIFFFSIAYSPLWGLAPRVLGHSGRHWNSSDFQGSATFASHSISSIILDPFILYSQKMFTKCVLNNADSSFYVKQPNVSQPPSWIITLSTSLLLLAYVGFILSPPQLILISVFDSVIIILNILILLLILRIIITNLAQLTMSIEEFRMHLTLFFTHAAQFFDSDRRSYSEKNHTFWHVLFLRDSIFPVQ